MRWQETPAHSQAKETDHPSKRESQAGNVTWSYKSTYDGQPLTVQFAGVVDSSNTIKGSVNVPEFGASGDFIAKQSKQ
jgi:hypothetical protein